MAGFVWSLASLVLWVVLGLIRARLLESRTDSWFLRYL
jgi:hypothetical protein